MADRRAYKTDESFLEKLAIGATGTKSIFDDLTRHDHRPVELERGSMSYKIWKAIKVKRARVPDLLCVRCGIRVESRAKTKLEVSMSHSKTQPDRGWDTGLQDDDRVAFILCEPSGDRPIDWVAVPPVQYITVADMRQAVQNNTVQYATPKGAQEGFEFRLTWPTTTASADGVVTAVNPGAVQFRRVADGRTVTLQLARRWGALTPRVEVGETVSKHQVLASAVPVHRHFGCNQLHDPSAHFADLLTSPNLSDRYAAVKGIAPSATAGNVQNLLKQRIHDAREHIYVKLEAAATLFRSNDAESAAFIEQTLFHDDYLPHRLESVIILGEIRSRAAEQLLIRVLQDHQQPHTEIRAGAAWALGEMREPRASQALIQSLAETELGIRIEAARALAKIAQQAQEPILSAFGDESDEFRPGLAWSLSHSGPIELAALLPHLKSLDARQWAAWIIGSRPQEEFVSQIEQLRHYDPELYFAATVLWKVIASWTYGLEEY